MRIIVAINADGNIDFKTTKEDLRRFAALTIGYPVIMGMNTWLSLPKGGGLPNRENIVLSKTRLPHGATHIPEWESAVENYPGAWVIGGAQIYELAFPLADMVYMSVYPNTHGGSLKLRGFKPDDFDLLCKQQSPDHVFAIYGRKQP